jgi:hypothetical protein
VEWYNKSGNTGENKLRKLAQKRLRGKLKSILRAKKSHTVKVYFIFVGARSSISWCLMRDLLLGPGEIHDFGFFLFVHICSWLYIFFSFCVRKRNCRKLNKKNVLCAQFLTFFYVAILTINGLLENTAWYRKNSIVLFIDSDLLAQDCKLLKLNLKKPLKVSLFLSQQ